MAGRIYSVPFSGVAVTAQQDFFEILAGSNKLTELLEIHLSQSTEVGDAAEEGLSVLLKTGQTTTGSGGSTVTAIPSELGNAAFSGTCKANNTTKASNGTIVTHKAWNWNVRVPLDVIFTPETVVPFTANRLTVELGTSPADSITMSGYLVVRETG